MMNRNMTTWRDLALIETKPTLTHYVDTVLAYIAGITLIGLMIWATVYSEHFDNTFLVGGLPSEAVQVDCE